MPIPIEVSLRLPNISVRAPHEPSRVISNADVRFIKRIDVPSLPGVGDDLELSTRQGYTLSAVVKRLDWHEEKALFVVGCQYGSRSVTLEAYESLRADPDWAMRPLL
jgi:hypothetical protein